MFNSVCGEQQPIPQGMKAGTEKTRAPNIRRPPRARDPQENHRRDNRGLHPEKGRGEPEGGTSDSHSVGAQGAVAASPQAPPAADHTRADRALGPEPKGPPPHNRGPARPVGPGPANRPPRVGRRFAPNILPRREKSQRTGGILHPARAWWWGGVDLDDEWVREV